MTTATATTAPAKKPKAKKEKEKPVERPIRYPNLTNEICVGETALTVERAKFLLGWVSEKENLIANTPDLTEEERLEHVERLAFGDDFFFDDFTKDKIRLTNNTMNRPFDEDHAYSVAQIILNRQWADSRNSVGEQVRTLNGESIIIGRTGQVLSGQHRLIGLVLASQVREGGNRERWHELWPEEPSIETMISFGIDESPETTRTLDCVKPRSLADVLFSDGHLFSKPDKEGKMTSRDERDRLCRELQSAVKMLWIRTCSKANKFAPHRNNAADLDFIDRHQKLLSAVEFIHSLNEEKVINQYLSPGYAAAFLYLQGASTSDGEAYWATVGQGTANEKRLKWTNWNKARAFWEALAKKDTSIIALFNVTRPGSDGGDGSSLIFGKAAGSGSIAERISAINKAWLFYVAGEIPLTPGMMSLSYKKDETSGEMDLDEFPDIGGIDFGNPKPKTEKTESNPEGDDEENPDDAEVAALESRLNDITGEKTTKKAEGGRKKKEKEESPLDRAARLAAERSAAGVQG